jgi:hypothetical protein
MAEFTTPVESAAIAQNTYQAGKPALKAELAALITGAPLGVALASTIPSAALPNGSNYIASNGTTFSGFKDSANASIVVPVLVGGQTVVNVKLLKLSGSWIATYDLVNVAAFDPTSINTALALKSNTSELPIKKTIQLLDKSKVIPGFMYGNTQGVIAANAIYSRIPLFKTTPGKTYTIIGTSTTAYLGNTYNSNAVSDATTTNANRVQSLPGGAMPYSFVAGTDAQWLGINVPISGGFIDTIMVFEEPGAVVSSPIPAYQSFGYGADATKLIGTIPGVISYDKAVIQRAIAGFKDRRFYFEFNGVDRYLTLPATYKLSILGDYLEFKGKNRLAVAPASSSNSWYLFCGSNNRYGYSGSPGANYIRLRDTSGSASLVFNTSINLYDVHVIKLQVVNNADSTGLLWEVLVDGVSIGTQPKARDFSFSVLGRDVAAYAQGEIDYFLVNYADPADSAKKLTYQLNANGDTYTGGTSNYLVNIEEPLPAIAPVVINPNIFLTYSPNQTDTTQVPSFRVYVKSALLSDYYIGFDIFHNISTTSFYLNVYKIAGAYWYKYNVIGGIGTMGAALDQALIGFENEFVLIDPSTMELTGSFHGNEQHIPADLRFIVDGIPLTDIELSTAFSLRKCESFTFFQRSTLHKFGDAAHPVISNHIKEVAFGQAGYTVTNTIVNTTANPITFPTMYFGIMCVTNSHSAFANNNIDPTRTMTHLGADETHYMIVQGGDKVSFWNPTKGLSADCSCTILLPVTANDTAEVFIKDNVTYGKYYKNAKNVLVQPGGLARGMQTVRFKRNV